MLDDVLRPGLALVICGTAAGRESAARGLYYAGKGNKLWKVLEAVGLTDRELKPEECALLLGHGIGLTDIVKGQAGMDRDVTFRGAGVAEFRSRILRYRPGIVCFNGKRAAREFLGRETIEFGLQPERVGDTRLSVAPSTSGAASRWWSIEPWRELARLVKGGH